MISNCNTCSDDRTVMRTSDTMKALLVRLTTLLMMFYFSFMAMWAATATTTSLTLKSNGTAVTSLTSGKAVRLTASVKAGSASVTTGQVNFCDNAAGSCTFLHVLATAQLTSAGSASFSYVPGIGSHSYTAVFLATNADKTSTSSAADLTVTGTPVVGTTTTITKTGSVGDYTLSSTVTATGALTAPLIGDIDFVDTSFSNAIVNTAELVPSAAASTFTNISTPSAGSSSYSITYGDFNGDGKVDLAMANFGTATVTILLGNGDGTFAAPTTVSTTVSRPNGMLAADFNGDGKLDLAIANTYSAYVGILLGNGDGTFTSAANVSLAEGSYDLVTGDFNGDGKADLAVTSGNSPQVYIVLGNGDGTFTSAATISTAADPYAIVTADFNGDGKADLALTDYSDYQVEIFLGNGDGTFTAGQTPSTGNGTYSLAVGDFNGDGKADLAVASASSNNVSMLLGNGDGTFTAAASPSTGSGTVPYSILVADFNQDGKADLATSNDGNSTMSVLLGNGDGTFTLQTDALSTGGDPYYSVVADFNGDGVPDLAAESYDAGTDTIFLTQVTQSASATLSGVSVLGVSGSGHEVEAKYVGDSNFIGSASSTVPLTGEKAATVLSLSSSASTSGYGAPVVLTAALSPFDPEGTISNGTAITFQSGSTALGTGTLSGGVATLGIATLPLGKNIITASFPGTTYLNSSTSGAQTVTVGKGATTLALTASSTNPAAGATVVLTATLSPYVGTNGDTITFYNGTTSIGTGKLSNGVATLSLSSLPTGANSVKAEFAGDTDLDASTSSIDTVTVTVDSDTGIDFSVSSGASSITVPSSGSATYTLAVSPVGNSVFTSDVKFAVTGGPDLGTVSFSPRTIASGSDAKTVTMTVNLSGSALLHPGASHLGRTLAPVLLGMLLLPFSGKLRRSGKSLGSLVCLFVLAIAGLSAMTGMTGCGGSGAQTYNMTVTATSGSLSKSADVVLIVQ